MQGSFEAILAWGVSGAIHVGALAVLYHQSATFIPANTTAQLGGPVFQVSYEGVREEPVRKEERPVAIARSISTKKKIEVPSAPHAPSGGQVGVVRNAELVGSIAPEYPLGSRRRKEEGTAVFQVLVSAHGLPDDVKLLESSGYPALDQAAIKALNEAHFRPAIQDGVPAKSSKELSFIFRLRD